MSYSTTLYAVDLDRLKTAIGSHDDVLLRQLRKAISPPSESPREVELRGDVTLRVTGDGRLFFDGQETSLDAMTSKVRALDAGTLEVVMEMPWTDMHEKVVLANNENVPKSGLDRVTTRFETDDPNVAKNLSQAPVVSWSRNAPKAIEEAAPHFSVTDQALVDLISGRLSSSGPQHGRALEVFCYVLGRRLPDDDMLGDLAPLCLNTPLERERCPVPLNRYSDFPAVSFLTVDEVANEARRLSEMDLSFPSDEDIEEAREMLAQCVQSAAGDKLAIVAFYQ